MGSAAARRILQYFERADEASGPVSAKTPGF